MNDWVNLVVRLCKGRIVPYNAPKKGCDGVRCAKHFAFTASNLLNDTRKLVRVIGTGSFITFMVEGSLIVAVVELHKIHKECTHCAPGDEDAIVFAH